MMRWLAIVALLLAIGPLAAAEPPTIALATGHQARLAIVVAVKASAAVKATAAELAEILGKLAGATFMVTTGDGHDGIVIGLPADFTALPVTEHFATGPFAREDYLLRSHAAGLCLLGATDLAVSHAAWDLLHRLGHRQFFPGPVWEVLPAPADLALAVDVRESPSFNARRIWYNWGLWGYNDEPYRQWCVRNRMAKGFDLNSGHSYESIIAANRAEFDRHPEYYALVGGERKLRGDAKFCVANAGLRALVAAHAVKYFTEHPQADSISMDPSDGGGWCECADCARLGGVSNRVLTLANEVATAINALGLGPKYVGMYAYNHHSAPPTIMAHPQVIVSATTAFIGGGFTFDQVVQGWQHQGATIGVYDYLSVVDWDWNLPRGGAGSRPAAVAANLARFHAMGARFYDAESGDCWGPCGLGYYVASRVLWDVGEAKRVEALREDFITRAFADAQEPMREFYRLITSDSQRRPPSDLLGRMYRQLDSARHASHDARVQARLDQLVLYTRYAELYYARAAGTGSVDDVARHAYRMRTTMMVHSYGLWSRLLSQQAAHDPKHPLKDDRPFTADELASMVANGIAKYQPVEPGFASVEFSRNLVPAAPRLALAPSKVPGRFPGAAQEYQRYFLWMPDGGGNLALKVTVQKVWATRAPRLSLFSPLDVTLDPVAVAENYQPDGTTNAIALATPHGGLHWLVAVDGGDHTRIDWPAIPITVESGIDTPRVTEQFRGSWTLYCYVPKGTRLVAGWASRVANWAPRISGKLRDGDGNEVLDFAKQEEGWFKVPVPAGQDGKLWLFDNSEGQRLLMTVPPYLARSAAELLLPQEVVAADAKP